MTASSATSRGHLCRLAYDSAVIGRPVSLLVEAFDEDVGAKDDVIGSATVDVRSLVGLAVADRDLQVSLTARGAEAVGKVNLVLGARLLDSAADEAVTAEVAGCLIVTVLDGHGLPDHDTLHKQDPYVVVKLVDVGGNVVATSRTGTVPRGGAEPVWTSSVRS